MKSIFSILIMTYSSLLYSQNTLVEYDILSSGKASKNQIIFNDSLSISKLATSSSATIPEVSFFMKKNFENVIYETEKFLNITFYVKDSLHSMKWQLTNDTSTILNEKCLCAKTYFRGRHYTAFYSTKYANSNGPWKLGGLPGLILSAKSDDNFVQWSAVKIIENYADIVEPIKVDQYKFLEWNEYVAKFIGTVEKWIKLAKSSAAVNNSIESKIKIDATEIIYPKLQTGEGITF